MLKRVRSVSHSSSLFATFISVAVFIKSFPGIHCEIAFGVFHLKNGLHLIQDGTKWCGTGNIADNDLDLGEFRALDACCRTHDKCNNTIGPGESKNGLTNNAPYFMSHCACDFKLYDCLQRIRGPAREVAAALDVGHQYFDVLEVKCFNYTFPADCCKSDERPVMFAVFAFKQWKCIQYEFDTSAQMTWQWFDTPFYKK